MNSDLTPSSEHEPPHLGVGLGNLPIISEETAIDWIIQGRELIDLRSPIEVEASPIPGATNLPLLDNHQREAVGTCYRHQGRAVAIELGHQLISGQVKEQRMGQWIQFIERHPNAAIFCFRGGLRSKTVQEWLAQAGYLVPRVQTGSKGIRNFLIKAIPEILNQARIQILGGLSGTSKTHLLGQIQRLPGHFTIDLEALARHKGSAFGRPLKCAQPGQIYFENQLAIELIRFKQQNPGQVLWLESESPTLGHVVLPPALVSQIKQSPLVIVEESIENRVEQIWKDYILSPSQAGNSAYEIGAHLLEGLESIRSKLDRTRYMQIQEQLENYSQSGNTSLEAHASWIQELLQYYYDPFYLKHIRRSEDRVVWRGSGHNLLLFLSN